MLIGVDIGGTFTDLVRSEAGQLKIHKLLSTPHNPAEAMLNGLTAIGATPSARVSHGSTVATNAILERNGARTALLITQGFKDLLAIGRQNRPKLYELAPTLPKPLIPQNWCYEIPERMDFNGDILTPLDIHQLTKIIDLLKAEQIESVAVCLLYSYINPIHEHMIRDALLQHFEPWQISLSSDVLPEFREYERASTVALDAYVRPVMNQYLTNLQNQLGDQPLLVMKSDGGLVRAKTASQQAIQTALSGPAAGVIGAFHMAQLAGYDHIITLDMGGTSTDVALCAGKPHTRPQAEIDGLPLRIPLIDIETVGAGGGSIARLDAGGALRVGPESAGANPGPIVYGQGGQQITVSDANTILGRLDADHFLGGGMTLDLENAQHHLQTLATDASLSIESTALGIIDIANANIDRAVRRVSVARGYDPRDFTLVAFGGAGALHACDVAERLMMKQVFVPQYPGVMCALGLLLADVQRDYSHAILQPVTTRTYKFLQQQATKLRKIAEEDLQSEGISSDAMHFTVSVDLRYQGQAYELSIPFNHNMINAFHLEHERLYGYSRESHLLEVVNLRLRAIGQIKKPLITPQDIHPNDGSSGYLGEKDIYFRDGQQIVALYQRERLQVGATLKAPALIFQLDSTILIPPRWRGFVDGYHNLILEYQS